MFLLYLLSFIVRRFRLSIFVIIIFPHCSVFDANNLFPSFRILHPEAVAWAAMHISVMGITTWEAHAACAPGCQQWVGLHVISVVSGSNTVNITDMLVELISLSQLLLLSLSLRY